MFELMQRQTNRGVFTIMAVLSLNVFIVWYLFQNRKRLFRHH
jgi:hypothetical protein